MYLLDTNACIRVLNGDAPQVTERLRAVGPAGVFLCAVVKAELAYGAWKSARRAANLRLIERFCAPMASLPFDDSCAMRYGEIRAQLEQEGTPIGPNDLMIAATAMANDLTLVTHDTAEFSRVVRLAFEDWEA